MKIKSNFHLLRRFLLLGVFVTLAFSTAVAVPKLPIGMNIPGMTYYSNCLIFTDAMTAAGDMMTSYDGGPFDSEKIADVPRDVNGYPTQLPYTTSDGKSSFVFMMINNYYSGRYVMTFEGGGTIDIFGGPFTKVNNNKYYIDFDGTGSDMALKLMASTNGNHLRNFKIIPEAYDGMAYPTFNPTFLEGLRPFHAFRFMDWIGTNNSTQSAWSDRVTKTYYTQASSKGASYEYAIELANELNADAWVTVPHLADDNFITQTARLWRDGLEPNLKVYCEYSNEIWNWQFYQAMYPVDKAPGATNAYVSSDLAAIEAGGGDFPEKDAYMIARNFRLWKAEFSGASSSRLIRVAAVQHGWMDNTRRVLNYLFDVDGAGCDVVSPGGYFNFQESDHDGWLARCGTASPVTPAEILDATSVDYKTNEALWTDETALYASQRGVGYVVYEGGQHMQPYLQGDWCYNQAVYDAQIHPKMYDMYMENFSKLTEPAVNCSLFMAFSYLGQRENKYGSWGHLESMSQIGNPGGYRTIAPKYQALLDANTEKIIDLVAPAKPTGLSVGTIGSKQVVLNWNASVNAVGTTIYDVYKGGVWTGSTTNTTYTATALTPSTLYSFYLIAKDNAGSAAATTAVTATTTAQVIDITAPSIPTNLVALSITQNSLTLNWTASTDQEGVTAYDVYKDATLIGSPTTNSFAVSGLAAATGYSFTVKAKDEANNISDASAPLSVSTLSIPGQGIASWDTYQLHGTWSGGDPDVYTPILPVATSAPGAVGTAGVTVSPLTISSTMVARSTNSAEANLLGVDGLNSSCFSFATAKTEGNYLECTITPLSGKSVTITSIDIAAVSGGADGVCTLTSSVDAHAAALSTITLGAANQFNINPLQTFTVTGHAALTAPVTFRFYFHAAAQWGLEYSKVGIGLRHPAETTTSLQVNGSVANVITALTTQQATGYTIYPNPATDKLRLNFGTELKTATISILDLQGRSLLSQTAANTQVESLDISSLNNGIYFVRVIADGKVMNSKFVKK